MNYDTETHRFMEQLNYQRFSDEELLEIYFDLHVSPAVSLLTGCWAEGL
ncbi:MAG: hypothetical protein JSW09_09665 [Pseudomonadota bacterium]|nr:MAG: hypothetical protein JSW09_09665 [Pseudomonadota bacterium]